MRLSRWWRGWGWWVALLAPVAVPISWNDLRFVQFERRVGALPMPPKTHVLERVGEFGHLVGNGNHCDHRVMLLIESERSVAALQAYFESHPIQAPSEADGGTSVNVVDPSRGITEGMPTAWWHRVPRLGNHLYVVTVIAITPAGLDARCM